MTLNRMLRAGLIAFAAATLAAAPAIAALKTTVRGALTAIYTGSGDLGSAQFVIPYFDDTVLLSGTGAAQADLIFADQRTIAASGSEDLDLAGVLTDPFGATLTFVKVKAIIVKAASTNTNNVVVGNATLNDFVGPWSADATTSVPPGGTLLVTAPAAGWTVAATTGDLLKIANSGGSTSVTYDIVIVGTSA